MASAGGGVRVTRSADLATAVVAGFGLSVLAQSTPPEPLGYVAILGRSGGGPPPALSLVCSVSLGGNIGSVALASLGFGPLRGVLQPQRELMARFHTGEATGGLFILDDSGTPHLAVGGGIVPNQLVISCGFWPALSPVFGPRAPARPVSDVAAAELDLDAFCSAVEVSIDAAYRRAGVEPPDLHLHLRAPAAVKLTPASIERRVREAVARIPSSRSPVQAMISAGDRSGEAPPDGFALVGGQDQAKRELEALCLALRDPGMYATWGIRPPKGVLLYGPPGTGKTLLARCVAAEAGAAFYHIKVSDITSRWYGESERRLQDMFNTARRSAPAVIFFDEIDALAPPRDDAHEATKRTLSTLLENMDGLQEGRSVVVLAATNRIEALDQALTRPGRFDKLIEVPLPDRAARRAIFGVHLSKAETQAGRRLFDREGDPDWDSLLDVTEGASGADVAEIVRSALEAKVRAGVVSGVITGLDLLDHATAMRRRW